MDDDPAIDRPPSTISGASSTLPDGDSHHPFAGISVPSGGSNRYLVHVVPDPRSLSASSVGTFDSLKDSTGGHSRLSANLDRSGPASEHEADSASSQDPSP